MINCFNGTLRARYRIIFCNILFFEKMVLFSRIDFLKLGLSNQSAMKIYWMLKFTTINFWTCGFCGSKFPFWCSKFPFTTSWAQSVNWSHTDWLYSLSLLCSFDEFSITEWLFLQLHVYSNFKFVTAKGRAIKSDLENNCGYIANYYLIRSFVYTCVDIILIIVCDHGFRKLNASARGIEIAIMALVISDGDVQSI